MSWGAQIKIVPGKGWEEKNVAGMETDEHRLQFQIAKEAVATVLNTGALGGPTHEFAVSMSGHGNPNGEPVSGWANDFVNISISQVST